MAFPGCYLIQKCPLTGESEPSIQWQLVLMVDNIGVHSNLSTSLTKTRIEERKDEMIINGLN